MQQKVQVETEVLRQFGQLVGAVFIVIGCWPLFLHGSMNHLWALIAGGVLVALGSIVPRSLVHLYHFWMGLGHALAWLNTRIILGIIFFGLITPMGICMRVLGKRVLPRTFDRTMTTYRIMKAPRPRTHFRHQF